jgi:hypothetical protein
MNRILLIVFVVLAVSVVSCKDDDAKPSYSFEDQDAQGKINNEPWTYTDGYATADQFFVITLTLDEDETGCAISVPERDRVSFIAEFDTKVYPLGTGSTVYTVTLTDAENPQDHHIALEGAIEITEVTATTVSGRLDARVDNGNFINGNFTVQICQ